jgi:prepilin-type processing-associated H-X9-DG protein
VNGDGHLDAVEGDGFSGSPPLAAGNTLVRLGDGQGGFAEPIVLPYLGELCDRAADFDLDASLDLVGIPPPGGEGFRVLHGDGAGTLTPGPNHFFLRNSLPGGQPLCHVADVNGDGKADVMMVDLLGQMNVMFGDGHGEFVDLD